MEDTMADKINIQSVQRASESWEVTVKADNGLASFNLADPEGVFTEADIRDWVGKLSHYTVAPMIPDDNSSAWNDSYRGTIRANWFTVQHAVETMLGSPQRAVQWLTKVVFDLGGQTFTQLSCKHVPDYVRYSDEWMSTWKAALEGLTTQLTEAMAESLENAQWHYENDAGDFNRYRMGRVEDGKVVATPYEAEERVALHYLATATPYQLWSAMQEVRDAAVYALDDYLDEGSLVGDDGGETNCKSVAKAAQEAFEALVKAIDKRIATELAEEAHRKACEAAAAAARPNYDRSPVWEAGT